MADTLMDAFDYRRWFAFGLHEQADGRPRPADQAAATRSARAASSRC